MLGMVTRLQRGLRLLLAVLALGCAVLGAAEPVAAAPSCYPASLALPSQSAASRVSPGRRVGREVTPPRVFVSQLSAAARPAPARKVSPPTATRAPRLYLRHCVLLR